MEINNCPYCRGQAEVTEYYNNKLETEYYVECLSPTCSFFGRTKKTPEEAGKDWNRIRVVEKGAK